MRVTFSNGRILLILLAIFIASCSRKEKKEAITTAKKIELIIYCENSVVPPLLELKTEFEKHNDCNIKIHNDCSFNLVDLIRYSKQGDLFIPASRSAFDHLKSQVPGALTDSIFIGFNQLVFMIKKSNPTQFNGDLLPLTDKKHSLIIANPETSSLGYDTKKVLSNSGYYEKIIPNVVALSTDSRGLIKSITNNKAGVIISWSSTFYQQVNKNDIQILPINTPEITSKEVYAGLLSFTRQPGLAREFMRLSTSEFGNLIFKKYGFSKRKTFIF